MATAASSKGTAAQGIASAVALILLASTVLAARYVLVPVIIGTAGWNIPRDIAEEFPAEGTALERYSARFPAVEVNSSFHRPHRISTWERWRTSVPDGFRFSVKAPKQITHARKLFDCEDELGQFLEQAGALKEKLAVLLFQLPPKLSYEEVVAREFFSAVVARTPAAVACEPRNFSWFTEEADNVLRELRVARVAADPSVCDEAARAGGWPGLSYWRLHGSPIIYRSSYKDRVQSYAAQLQIEQGRTGEVWCVLDNTASSAGTADALALLDALNEQ